MDGGWGEVAGKRQGWTWGGGVVIPWGYGGSGFGGRIGFGLWWGLLWRGGVGAEGWRVGNRVGRGLRGLGEKMKDLGKEHSWEMWLEEGGGLRRKLGWEEGG